jgi:conjugative transposon TraN protein
MLTKLKNIVMLLLSSITISESVAQALVEVTFNKTSSIVFPTSITSVDRGSRDLLAQKVKGVDNVLQIKAGKPNFKETNLTVITTDGRLHHFLVRYAEVPKVFTIQASEVMAARARMTPVHFKNETTSSEMEKHARQVLGKTERSAWKSTAHHGMTLSLKGVYIHGNTMFYHLKVSNSSNIPFHTEFIRFYVRDKQRVKRTASQEVEENPLFHLGSVQHIKGKSAEEVVYALPKFTIPDAKILNIELLERKGGRHLSLSVRNRIIMRAKVVSGN